jgi:quinolinate synthase
MKRSMTREKIFEELRLKLHDTVPEAELWYKSEIIVQINELKEKRNALILGHNYMEPVLYQSVPDFVGDSLELSRQAAQTDKDIIVFCGVHFMAETAKILSPHKTVLVPSAKAGCSLADGITAQDVRWLRKKYPGAPVVAYVNTTAEVKAEADICCTSANASAIVQSLLSETIIFVPDEYMARNIAAETGKHVVLASLHPADEGETQLDVQLVGWHARCEVHEKFTVADLHAIRKQFPDVVIAAHPECSPEVIAEVDFSGSTTAMIRYVENTTAPRYLLLTECSMADNIVAANPGKEMLRLCSVRCPHMNEITLEDTLESLLRTRYVVDVPEPVRSRAYEAVRRMLTIEPAPPSDRSLDVEKPPSSSHSR